MGRPGPPTPGTMQPRDLPEHALREIGSPCLRIISLYIAETQHTQHPQCQQQCQTPSQKLPITKGNINKM